VIAPAPFPADIDSTTALGPIRSNLFELTGETRLEIKSAVRTLPWMTKPFTRVRPFGWKMLTEEGFHVDRRRTPRRLSPPA
jgi:hypothetical protein